MRWASPFVRNFGVNSWGLVVIADDVELVSHEAELRITSVGLSRISAECVSTLCRISVALVSMQCRMSLD